MDLMTWVGTAAGCALVVLLAVVILGRRVDQLGEQLMDLRQLQKYTQQIEQDQARVVAVMTDVAAALPDLRSLKAQLDEVKRQHAELSVRLEAMARALGELRASAGSIEEIRRGQTEATRAVSSMANLVQRWCLGLNTAAVELERSTANTGKVVSIDASSPGHR
jgi:septal ring factor EnvC (AmiA/AmiB activator)